MPNNCLSVLYKHIIQVENKNVGLKVCVCGGGGGGHKHTIALPIKKVCVWGVHLPPLSPRFLCQCNTFLHTRVGYSR